MKIHKIAVKRPITTLMCVLIVIVLGFISLTNLSVELMPDINIPIAVVSTSYPGVGPEEIEGIVTDNIESAISTVSGIKNILSQSSEGHSLVIIEFNTGVDMDVATLDLRDRIDRASRFLPDDIESPMVLKIDPNMEAVAHLGVFSNNDANDVALKQLVEDWIKPRLERLEGVASVSVAGGKTREIKVEVDPLRLSSYNLSINEVLNTLRLENLNQPGGTVQYGDKGLVVRSMGEFQSLEDIKLVPIALPTGNSINLEDIAEVKDGYKTVDTLARINGHDSIGITVQKQTDANTVEVVNLIKKEMQQIQKSHQDITIELVFDQGRYIEDSISNVVSSAIIGAVLAVIILFVFLKNMSTTFIIGTAIPISIIATFVLIYFSGITLNLISLGGLALGVGMLLDNAIVVLENIYRYRSEGHSPISAAINGTQEVSSAVLASTLTTVVVFLPVIFTKGIVAELFRQLTMTVVFSLLASLIIALTLIPMLSARILKMPENNTYSRFNILNKILLQWDVVLEKTNDYYRKILRWVLVHRKKTIASVLLIFVASMALIPLVGVEFMPPTDEGNFTVEIEAPQGSLLEVTNDITLQVEGILFAIPEVERMAVEVGGSGDQGGLAEGGNTHLASITTTLLPLRERNRSTSEIIDEVRRNVQKIPGADIKVHESDMSMGGGVSSSPVAINILGPEPEILRNISMDIKDIVENVEGTRQVEASISEGRPEAQIYVDRKKASRYGINTYQVSNLIRTAIDGQVATRYKVAGEEIDIKVLLPEASRSSFEQLKNIKIMTPRGIEIPLMDLADVTIAQGPVEILRQNQERYVMVNSDIFGRDVGSINRDIQTEIDRLHLPAGYSIEFGGDQEQIQESFTALLQALILGMILVYMVMASQFESLSHPFIVMFSVPLAYTGSALALVVTGRALGVTAFIGIIMLAGIVVNNAIVLISYINDLMKEGMTCNEAILKAGPTRLRPILMTSLTTILGLIPLAIGIGEGAETQAPMATVVIGGLISSTILTLLIVPVIYTSFDSISHKFSKIKKKSLT
ncbi:MAG: efflux RND transporter permease subunit [Clostridiaceae bacterium]|nr:efflux RND transporter permease subunit [Clostridiaceae bacterium]